MEVELFLEATHVERLSRDPAAASGPAGREVAEAQDWGVPGERGGPGGGGVTSKVFVSVRRGKRTSWGFGFPGFRQPLLAIIR